MSTISEVVASNTTADVYVFNNTRYIITDEPTPSWALELIESLEAINIIIQALISKFDQHDNEDENLESLEEPMPSWARTLLENEQSFTIKLDQIDNRIKNLESPDESDSWEDSSPQIEIPEEPINDHLKFSNFVF